MSWAALRSVCSAETRTGLVIASRNLGADLHKASPLEGPYGHTDPDAGELQDLKSSRTTGYKITEASRIAARRRTKSSPGRTDRCKPTERGCHAMPDLVDGLLGTGV